MLSCKLTLRVLFAPDCGFYPPQLFLFYFLFSIFLLLFIMMRVHCLTCINPPSPFIVSTALLSASSSSSSRSFDLCLKLFKEDMGEAVPQNEKETQNSLYWYEEEIDEDLKWSFALNRLEVPSNVCVFFFLFCFFTFPKLVFHLSYSAFLVGGQ